MNAYKKHRYIVGLTDGERRLLLYVLRLTPGRLQFYSKPVLRKLKKSLRTKLDTPSVTARQVEHYDRAAGNMLDCCEIKELRQLSMHCAYPARDALRKAML